ncbi:MAG TPA: hypothetical protein VGG74_37950 [Kofleriaceae bacterium]
MRRVCHIWLVIVTAGCGFEAPAPSSSPSSPTEGETLPQTPAGDPTADETVEVKLELADGSAALATLGIKDSDATTLEDVWFYDTDSLSLLSAGVILRARKVHDGADDATVKARPMLPDETAPGWLSLDGSKCEVDETTASAESSCSLTSTPATGTIDDVGSGAAIASLYDADQLVFLGSRDGTVDLDALSRFGPIASTDWTVSVASLPQPLALERWLLGDGTLLLEASFRVDHADAPAGMAALLAWANANALELAAMQVDKTSVALAALAN